MLKLVFLKLYCFLNETQKNKRDLGISISYKTRNIAANYLFDHLSTYPNISNLERVNPYFFTFQTTKRVMIKNHYPF